MRNVLIYLKLNGNRKVTYEQTHAMIVGFAAQSAGIFGRKIEETRSRYLPLKQLTYIYINIYLYYVRHFSL